MYLYENQDFDFGAVRASIERFFGPGHSVTIHDGDGAILLGRISGHYCAGTVHSPTGVCLATFVIDYVTKEEDGGVLRNVVGVHIGPRGHWCRSVADGEVYDRWVDQLSQQCSSKADLS